jgi:hypothetical protein
MKAYRILRIDWLLVICLLLVSTVTACAPIQMPLEGEIAAAEKPESLLFVGNSLTYYNGGMERHVKSLASSATPATIIEVEEATQSGATLKVLYEKKGLLEKIRVGGHDVVILQDDIPELTEHTIEPFFTYARLFNQEIVAAGGETVLFMAWPYARLGWVTLEEIADAHRKIGKELDVRVAPVGIAFQRAMAERPGLDMISGDTEHESMHGTYLAANVIYATLFNKSPEGFTYRPSGVSEEEAAFLQRIAWETVIEWQKNP